MSEETKTIDQYAEDFIQWWTANRMAYVPDSKYSAAMKRAKEIYRERYGVSFKGNHDKTLTANE